jgi:hypothetical protein
MDKDTSFGSDIKSLHRLLDLEKNKARRKEREEEEEEEQEKRRRRDQHNKIHRLHVCYLP